MVSREIIEIWTCIIEHVNVPIRFAIDISAFAIFPKENKKKTKKASKQKSKKADFRTADKVVYSK